MKFKCPDCKEELDEFIEVGTFWDYISAETGDTTSRKKTEVEFYFCECGADITSEVNEWFRKKWGSK